MTESTTCCHTHEVMDVAAAIVTPGEDVDALKAELEQTQDAAMWVVKNFQEWQDSGDGLATLIASISKLATFIKEKP